MNEDKVFFISVHLRHKEVLRNRWFVKYIVALCFKVGLARLVCWGSSMCKKRTTVFWLWFSAFGNALNLACRHAVAHHLGALVGRDPDRLALVAAQRTDVASVLADVKADVSPVEDGDAAALRLRDDLAPVQPRVDQRGTHAF